MRYIADIEKHAVVVADTDTDSRILYYSDKYEDKDEDITGVRPTNMLTEDIAGYFPSHMITGEVTNTYAIVHPDDLINHIKQYMVFPEDKDWLFNIVNNKASTVLAHDIKGVLSYEGMCLPLLFDSSEMGIAVTQLAGVIARFKTASGAFRAVQIVRTKHETSAWPHTDYKYCELYEGGLLVYLSKEDHDAEQIYIKREADNLISIRLNSRLNKSSTVFSYCPDMDVITAQINGDGGINLSDYVFDDGTGLYVRCFNDCYYQFATPLRDLEKPVSKGYSFSHRYNHYTNGGINGLASLYNWTRRYDDNIGVEKIFTKNVNGVALNYNYDFIFNEGYDTAVARFRLTGVENGHHMVTDAITGNKYTVDDIDKRLLPCEYVFNSDYSIEDFSLEDYAKIRLGLIDIINDKQIRRNLQLRLNFLGFALDFDSAVAIEIDIPNRLFALFDRLLPYNKDDRRIGEYYDKFCIIRTEQDHFDLFRITSDYFRSFNHGSEWDYEHNIYPVINTDCSYLSIGVDTHFSGTDDYIGSQAMHYIKVNDTSATYYDLIEHKEMHGQFYNLGDTQGGIFMGESLARALGLPAYSEEDN